MEKTLISRSTQAQERIPAPGPLLLVEAFVNTLDVEGEQDTLSDPDALRDWLLENGLVERGTYVGESDLRLALEAREALRALASANNRSQVDPEAIETLNRVSGRIGLAVRFRADGSGELVPRVPDAPGGLARIFGVVYTAMAGGTWARMKACARASCRRVFYDHSKNRSSAWCRMTVCGNREKATAYRRRRRETAKTGAPGDGPITPWPRGVV